MYYAFVEFIILSYNFLVIFLFETENIWVVWFHLIKFSDVLHAFSCARTIGNLCLGVNILSHLAKSKECKANICRRPFPCVSIIESIPLLKPIRPNSWPSLRGITLSNFFHLIFLWSWPRFIIKIYHFSNILIVWSISASSILILPV